MIILPQLTDLLPRERLRRLRREYFLRLGVVSIMLAVALVIISAALLFPTYVYLATNAHIKQVRLANVDSTLVSANDAALSAQLNVLSQQAQSFTALQQAPSATGIIGETLTISHPGIVITSLAYTPPTGKTPGTLAVSGTATTRDLLRSYQLALIAASFVANANLPVSTYAKDNNIPFNILITLAL